MRLPHLPHFYFYPLRGILHSIGVLRDGRWRDQGQWGLIPDSAIFLCSQNFSIFFSPENTSKRILAVAASLFSASNLVKTQGNSRVARKAFAATVSRVVNQGLGVMLSQWDNFPAPVRDEFDKTKTLIMAALQTFEESGSESESDISAESAADLIADFFRDSAKRLEVLQETFASASYNAHGRLHLITRPVFSIKW